MHITKTIIPDRYTLEEAADALRISVSQIRNLVSGRHIHAHRDPLAGADADAQGKCLYISRGEIERYIRDREGTA